MAMSSQLKLSQNLSEEHLETLVKDTVRFILGNVPLKFPLRRQEIVKNVLKEYSKNFRVVMEKAKTRLKQDFGVDVVDVTTSGTSKVYLLISEFHYKNLPNMRNFLSKTAKAQQLLLTYITAYIFMRGGSIKEDYLWDYLVSMKLYKKDRKFVHEIYGDVYKAVQDFVRQMYLDYVTITTTDPPRHEFKLGKRTELEVSYRGLMEYVCHVYGQGSVASYHTQYQAALQQEHLWRERRLADSTQHTSSQSGQTRASSQVSQVEASQEPQPGPSGYQSKTTGANVDTTLQQASNTSQTRQRVKHTVGSSKRFRKI